MVLKKHFIFSFISCNLFLVSFSQVIKDTSLNVYFETNSFILDSIQIKNLNNFSSVFHVHSIIGYADSTGSQEYNLSLSKKRALSVYGVLSGHSDSVGKNILRFLGESSEEPELWKNRRVQIQAYQNLLEDSKSNTRVDSQDVIRTLDLDYVYFIPDKAIVSEESVPYLKQLAETLRTYKTEKFEIIGHINYQSRFGPGHLKDLYQLSENRARAIYDYLVQYGIPSSRMSFKGVGNSQPVYPSPVNDEQRRKNMRVQIIIRK
ncbi:MAG: OmpA family protein [Flavisolibacter sp.]